METAILLFFALVIEFIYDPISNMKSTFIINEIYAKYTDIFKSYIRDKFYLNLLFPLLVIIVIIFSTFLLTSLIHYIFSFLIYLIILIYCLKPNEYNQKMEDLKFAIENKEDLSKDKRLQYLLSTTSSTYNTKLITDNLFYNSTRHIFSVLFWFLILGPAGSLGYIILDCIIYSDKIKVDQKTSKELKNILSIMEYLPIKFTALSFAIVGNFESSIHTWKQSKQDSDLYKSNINFINLIGASSSQSGILKDDELINKISYTQTIISRALLTWLSIVFLLIIGGFFI